MTSVPRSLFFIPNLNGGGAQRTAINLVHHWPDDRPRPTLAVASASGAGRVWLTGIDPVDLGSGRLRWSLLPLRRLIRRQRPDIVFSTMVGANIVAAASMIGLRSPPILVVRETSHRARSTLSFAQRAAIGQAYRRAVVVVALSEGVRMELLEYYRLKPERVVMIHNPVDVDAFHSRASGHAHPWQGNGPMVVAAGRLVRQKGFDILLRAFAYMSTADTRLAILGEGPDREALATLAGELGLTNRILMPGHVADPGPWYAHAAAFVLSSRWEGSLRAMRTRGRVTGRWWSRPGAWCGRRGSTSCFVPSPTCLRPIHALWHGPRGVLVEAMACGAPVVAFDCPHGPADIIEDGHTGLLVPPQDVHALAESLYRLIGNQEFAGRLRVAGQRAARRFSAPVIARTYATLFDELFVSS